MQKCWDEMHVSELDYVKTPWNSPVYKKKFATFRAKEKIFDKLNKYSKRRHQRQQVHEIERANTENPVAFWDFIKRLSPRKKERIPWETCIDGHITTEKCEVINHWSNEFANLLTPPSGDAESQTRLESITNDNRERESCWRTWAWKRYSTHHSPWRR